MGRAQSEASSGAGDNGVVTGGGAEAVGGVEGGAVAVAVVAGALVANSEGSLLTSPDVTDGRSSDSDEGPAQSGRSINFVSGAVGSVAGESDGFLNGYHKYVCILLFHISIREHAYVWVG